MGFYVLALNGLPKWVSLMSVTPVLPAQPHSFLKEDLSFCCSFISPAFLHLGLPQVQVHLVFYVNQGAMLQKDHHVGEGTILSHGNLMCFAYIYLVLLWALA